MSRNSGRIREFFAIFIRTTFVFWGFLALVFVAQFLLDGKGSIAESEFLNPIIFTFFVIPFAAVFIALAAVQKQKKGDPGA